MQWQLVSEGVDKKGGLSQREGGGGEGDERKRGGVRERDIERGRETETDGGRE